MNQNLELKLQAWVDGELSASEARRIGEEIAGDAEAGRLVADLQALKSVLAGNELAMPVPETREFYWSKIERQIQRETGGPRAVQSPRRASWLNWLSPLAGLAGLACMMVLAVRPLTPAAFDEISSTGEGMEAVTFHDQSAGMTVVWLADASSASEQAPAVEPQQDTKTPDPGDSEVEME